LAKLNAAASMTPPVHRWFSRRDSSARCSRSAAIDLSSSARPPVACALTAKEPIMGQTIRIPSKDGSFNAYLAVPASGRGPGIVMCQEIFGVNGTMRTLADRYAQEGYVVLVPDLFWRIEPGVELDYSPEGWKRAFEFFQKYDQNKGVEDI